MSPEMRKRVLLVLALCVVALFVAGGIAAWFSRNDTICSDGKAPTEQRRVSLGQIEYHCRNGDFVTK